MNASDIYNVPIHFVYNQGLGYPKFQTIHFPILAINISNLSLFDIIFSHFTEYFKLSINMNLNMLNSCITELTFCWYLIKFLSFQMTHLAVNRSKLHTHVISLSILKPYITLYILNSKS